MYPLPPLLIPLAHELRCLLLLDICHEVRPDLNLCGGVVIREAAEYTAAGRSPGASTLHLSADLGVP